MRLKSGETLRRLSRSAGGPAPAALRHRNTHGIISHAFVPPRAAGEGPLALRQTASPDFNHALKFEFPKFPLVSRLAAVTLCADFMKADIHPKYVDAEIRCACGNVIKTRSTKSTVIVGICNSCHPFYTGQQKFVDTAGRVDKFQQRAAKTAAAQVAFEATKKKKK